MQKFTESQRMIDSTFNKIIVLLVAILLGKTIYTAVTGDFSYVHLFSITILTIAIVIFIVFQVHTTISKDQIEVTISPFSIYKKVINWKEVKKIEVVKYSAIREYGGWGYRRNSQGNAINPSGDKGIKIHFKNGKHLLVGTRKPDEAQTFLKSIGK